MSGNGTVYYLLSDQLGSTSIATDASGTPVSELRYDAWGRMRYSGTTLTDYTYTGQYSGREACAGIISRRFGIQHS